MLVGRFDKPETITAAARGADAGYLMGNFCEAGFDGETARALRRPTQ